MTIKVDVRGLEEVKYVLEGYQGTHMVGIVTEAAAQKTVEIMQEQPDDTPYKYISRARAYPDSVKDPRWNGYKGAPVPGYFSPKQYRFVMAAIRKGTIKIPYTRTGKLSGAWKVEGRLSRAKAVNDAPAAQYVFGRQPANQPRMVGWQPYTDRLDKKQNDIFDAAYEALLQEQKRREAGR